MKREDSIFTPFFQNFFSKDEVQFLLSKVLAMSIVIGNHTHLVEKLEFNI